VKLILENWKKFLEEEEEKPSKTTGDPGIPEETLNKLPKPAKKKLSINELNEMDLKYIPQDDEWEHMEKEFQDRIRDYAEYTKEHGVSEMKPIRFVDNQLEDGGHRINMMYYLDRQEPDGRWLDYKLPVAFYTTEVDWEELEKKDRFAFLMKTVAAKHIEDTIK